MKCELLKTIPIDPPGKPIKVVHSFIKGGNGSIYLSDEFNHRILIYANGSITSIGKKGSEPGSFWYPRGICLVNTGDREELFVCDSWNHRIQRFTTDGEYIGGFGSVGGGNDQLNEPVMLIAADDGVFILDRCNHKIVKRGFDGTPITSFGNHLTLSDEEKLNDPVELFLKPMEAPSLSFGFNYPCAFTQNKDGDFLIADTGNRRICHVTSEGTFKHIITLDSGEPPLCFPESIFLTSDGLILAQMVDARLKLIWGNDYNYCENVSLPAQDGARNFISGIISDDGRETIVIFQGNSLHSYLAPSKPSEIKSMTIGEMLEKMDIRSIPGFANRITHMPDEALSREEAIALLHKSLELADKSLQKLRNLEREYWTSAKAYFEKHFAYKTGGAQQGGLAADDNNNLMELEFRSVTQLEKRRGERKLFTGALAGASILLAHLHAKTNDDSIEIEIEKYRDILKKEFESASADFDQTLTMLKEKLGDIKTLDLGSALVACIGLIILHNYMSVYAACEARLPSAPEKGRYQLPDLPEALTPFNKDIRLIVHSAIFVLGDLCRDWGLHDSASIIYESLFKNPDDEWRLTAHIQMSHVYTAKKRFRESADLLEKASQISDTPSLPLMLELCKAYFKLGRLDDVFETGRAMYDIVADNLDSPYYSSAIVYSIQPQIILGKFDKAIDFINAVAEDKTTQEIVQLRGALYQLQENGDEAIDGLRRLIEKYPDTNTLRRGLAERLGLEGYKEEALKYIELEKTSYPDIINTMIESSIHRFFGDFDEALGILKKENEAALNFLPVAIEYFVNAYATKSEKDVEESLEAIEGLCGNENFFNNYIHATMRQGELIEKSLSLVQKNLHQGGAKIEINKLSSTTYQYIIST